MSDERTPIGADPLKRYTPTAVLVQTEFNGDQADVRMDEHPEGRYVEWAAVEAEQSRLRQELRQVLWINHGCPVSALYGDDGEMQCNALPIHGILDFKRDPLPKLVGAIAKVLALRTQERDEARQEAERERESACNWCEMQEFEADAREKAEKELAAVTRTHEAARALVEQLRTKLGENNGTSI